MTDPDDRHPTEEESSLSPVARHTDIETGAWLDIVSACKALDVTERTIQRRVLRGEIQRRTLLGGRAEFWISGAELSDVSPDTRQEIPQDERSVALAVVAQYGALIQRIEDLATENGHLRAELEAERERRVLPDTSAVTPDRRPAWIRWLWP